MKRMRLIPRLDVKGPNVVKGIQLEGLRIVGEPHKLAVNYYQQGADELIIIDIVASLYNRNNLSDIIAHAAKDIFIPITVGGGIRTVEDAAHLFRMGADKVAVNTAAIKTPDLLTNIANRFGSQSLVLSIEAKKRGKSWEAYIDNGRERTDFEVLEWIKQAQTLGVGEILLTSVDQEGMRKGFDLELVQHVAAIVTVPLIVCGGMGNESHLNELVQIDGVDAVSMASVLHYGEMTLEELCNV
ncbi:MAG: imidazole glycerol phosphate synthase cyclase subunit [Gammaproteobacteria bacterium]|nr:imidazole glycerol phosphate synthase cyclase subunit [Gammaproteobacteria bacterium]MCH9743464.1 imidazole glycerol phosphate synthase cyclase subunit [Gammaproteobacteria bacterium]